MTEKKSWKPTTKMASTGLAGAIVLVVVATLGTELEPEVASAWTLIVSVALGYLVPDKK